MSVRQKRLAADFERIGRLFASHPNIRIVETEGDPPERYKVEYTLAGLVIQDGKVVRKGTHLAEVYLPLGYPRQAPQCRMLSPIYHPNIAPHAICIGDHWSAGESLAALMARIGEMITFQSYNIKSPLNGEAARWAEQNMDQLPIQKVDLTVGIEELAAHPPAPPRPPPPPEVRWKSALLAAEDGPAFGIAAWAEAASAELAQDPAGAAVAPALKEIVGLLAAGDAAGAIRGFEPVRATPGISRFPQVHFLVALLQASQARTEKEIASLENATKVDATYALAWGRLGWAAARAGQAEKSAAAFRRCLHLNPTDPAARRAMK